jgi:hypothetical protein
VHRVVQPVDRAVRSRDVEIAIAQQVGAAVQDGVAPGNGICRGVGELRADGAGEAVAPSWGQHEARLAAGDQL